MIVDDWHSNYLLLLPRDVLINTLRCSTPQVREELSKPGCPFQSAILEEQAYWRAHAFAPAFLERTYLAYSLAHAKNEEELQSPSPAGLTAYSNNEEEIFKHMLKRVELNIKLEKLKDDEKFDLTFGLAKKRTFHGVRALVIDKVTFGSVTKLQESHDELKRLQKENMLGYVACLNNRKRLLFLIQKTVDSGLERTFPDFKRELHNPESQKMLILNLFKVSCQKHLPVYPLEDDDPYIPVKYFPIDLFRKLKRRIRPEKVSDPLMQVDMAARLWVLLYARGGEMFIFTIFREAMLFRPLEQEQRPLTLIDGAKLHLDVYKYVRSIIS